MCDFSLGYLRCTCFSDNLSALSLGGRAIFCRPFRQPYPCSNSGFSCCQRIVGPESVGCSTGALDFYPPPRVPVGSAKLSLPHRKRHRNKSICGSNVNFLMKFPFSALASEVALWARDLWLFVWMPSAGGCKSSHNQVPIDFQRVFTEVTGVRSSSLPPPPLLLILPHWPI